jgi:hypothetical protein
LVSPSARSIGAVVPPHTSVVKITIDIVVVATCSARGQTNEQPVCQPEERSGTIGGVAHRLYHAVATFRTPQPSTNGTIEAATKRNSENSPRPCSLCRS